MIDHPLRAALAAELHARPFLRLDEAVSLTHYAIYADGQPDIHETLLHALCRDTGIAEPQDGATHYAVQSPSATGLTWCNDTPHKVMAAVATEDGKSVVSRGWYGIAPGKCLHPDVTGQPKQVYSFAEAVDADNRTIKLNDKPLNWGGTKMLCTRDSKFEINEQGDCTSRGFASTGFAPVDLSSGGKTLRFAMP